MCIVPPIRTTGKSLCEMFISQLVSFELMNIMHFTYSIMLLIFKQMIFMQEILLFDNCYFEIGLPIKISHALRWESNYCNLNYKRMW